MAAQVCEERLKTQVTVHHEAKDGGQDAVFLIPGEAYPSEPGLTTCWVCGCRRQDVRLMFCHAQPLEIRPPDVPRRLRGALSR